jgi:hypothetical protein
MKGNRVVNGEKQFQPSASEETSLLNSIKGGLIRMISIKTAGWERKYQRYAVDQDGNTLDQIEVTVEGKPVRLVNFSLGGLYFLSMQRFSADATVHVSIDFGNRGKIALTGTVVQVRNEEDMWGVAIDFSKTFKL